MIHCPSYCQLLRERGFDFFSGVPDSLLKELCACVTDTLSVRQHVIAANEGAAVALAMGHYLGTGRPAVVYMQNSGLGNTVNPLTSLADPEVYGIPMLLVIGWRGQPGVKDEPQHVKQGRITLELLKTLGIGSELHPTTLAGAADALTRAATHMSQHCAPYALVVKKDTFEPYRVAGKVPANLPLSREDALIQLLDLMEPDAIIVATTGMASREVFEYRARRGQGHHRDFLTVGGMGHASQIALGLAATKPQRQVYCLDGDGAVLMHLGALATIGTQRPGNYRHIVINNGAHDSVGGQPTAGFLVDFPAIARACGYVQAESIHERGEILPAFKRLTNGAGPSLLEIRVRIGARSDLGRPTKSPAENKREFMNHLATA